MDDDLPSQSAESDKQLLNCLAYAKDQALGGLLQISHHLSRFSDALKARRPIACIRSAIVYVWPVGSLRL